MQSFPLKNLCPSLAFSAVLRTELTLLKLKAGTQDFTQAGEGQRVSGPVLLSY